MIKRTFIRVVCFMLSVPCFSQTGQLEEMDRFIQSKMKQWEGPGLVLGIVKNEELAPISWQDYNLLLMMNFPQATLQLDSDGTPETVKLNDDTYFKIVH